MWVSGLLCSSFDHHRGCCMFYAVGTGPMMLTDTLSSINQRPPPQKNTTQKNRQGPARAGAGGPGFSGGGGRLAAAPGGGQGQCGGTWDVCVLCGGVDGWSAVCTFYVRTCMCTCTALPPTPFFPPIQHTNTDTNTPTNTQVIDLLLAHGASPLTLDHRERPPYFLATARPARDAFRRARGRDPDRWVDRIMAYMWTFASIHTTTIYEGRWASLSHAYTYVYVYVYTCHIKTGGTGSARACRRR